MKRRVKKEKEKEFKAQHTIIQKAHTDGARRWPPESASNSVFKSSDLQVDK